MSFLTQPNVTLMDEEVNIQILHLPKNIKVTLYSFVELAPCRIYYSIAHYLSNQDGIIDLTRDISFGGGFYVGCESMGFLWSMKSHPNNKKKFARFTVDNVEEPIVINMQVFDGFKDSPAELHKGIPIASGTVTRTYMANGVRRIPINTNLKGTLFIPHGKGPFPATITVRGATPLLIETRAALLASRGIMAFVIVFYGREGLPKTYDVIDMDYFQQAIDFLRSQPLVDSSMHGIGILGVSLGGSIALVAASKLDGIRSVVNLSGSFYSDIVEYRSKQFVIPKRPRKGVPKAPVKEKMEAEIMATNPFDAEVQPYIIPFHKRKDVNYLLLFGADDLVCPSIAFSCHAKQLLDSVGHDKYKLHVYHKTGHLMNTPYDALFPASYGSWNDEVAYYGGEAKENNQAQIEAWREILRFFKTTLSSRNFYEGNSKL